jgi:hypothetical protein
MNNSRSRLLIKEQPHQAKAFEYYLSLGEHRSYEKVAAEFGVAQSTVKLWGKSFGWKDRIRERDGQVAREVATRTLTDETNRRERSLQIVHMALVQLAKSIAEGEIKMTLGDLDKIIRLEAFLSNEPDSRQEVVVHDLANKTDGELRAIVSHEMAMINELAQPKDADSQ